MNTQSLDKPSGGCLPVLVHILCEKTLALIGSGKKDRNTPNRATIPTASYLVERLECHPEFLESL